MKRILGLALPLLAMSLPAAAHTGHETGGFDAGLLHPVAGLDHLLAMLMVGLWAALLARRERRSVALLPASFLVALLGGAVLGFTGIIPPFLETGIAVTVIALGGVLLAALRPALPIGIATVAIAGLLHGVAHGAELPASVAPAVYAAGFLVTTGLLHAIGVFVGNMLLRRGGERALRAVGATGVVAGLVMTTV